MNKQHMERWRYVYALVNLYLLNLREHGKLLKSLVSCTISLYFVLRIYFLGMGIVHMNFFSYVNAINKALRLIKM